MILGPWIGRETKWMKGVDPPTCECSTCFDAWVVSTDFSQFDFALQLGIRSVFIVCPTCGNKRCPKATLHSLECTGSNSPGQKGSSYE